MASATVLVVDEEPGARAALDSILTANGYRVLLAEDGESALAAIEVRPDLVLGDLNGGLRLLQELKQRSLAVPVLLMTKRDAVRAAVSALRAGAADYLLKPLNTDELLSLIERALHGSRPDQESQPSKSPSDELSWFGNIVGRSPEVLRILRQVAQVAPSRATVLLTGETGSGKELFAGAIHQRSTRAAFPFVRVNCGALACNLLESELFGHERGAFTGAMHQRRGRFEQANGGTLLLDEIGEISKTMQVKLLRVVQEREFERVGGNETVQVDVRLIAATNRDLKKMVAEGLFREDLYYRLNVISLRLPPLRERVADIPLLAAHFLERFAAADEKPACGFSSDALELLLHYPWPGNVREMENVIQGAVVRSEGEMIEPRHLPPELTSKAVSSGGLPAIPGASILDFERYAILKTLEAMGGSISKTAALLGISVRKIQYRMHEYRATQIADFGAPSGVVRRASLRSAQ